MQRHKASIIPDATTGTVRVKIEFDLDKQAELDLHNLVSTEVYLLEHRLKQRFDIPVALQIAEPPLNRLVLEFPAGFTQGWRTDGILDREAMLDYIERTVQRIVNEW